MQPVAARQNDGLYSKRKPDVRLLSVGFTDEATGCDADDRQGGLAHDDGFAQHVGTSTEPPLPEAVADDGNASGGAVVVRGEDAAHRGTHAQDFEKPAGDQSSGHFFRYAIVDADLPGIEAALRGHHSREAFGVIPQLLELL